MKIPLMSEFDARLLICPFILKNNDLLECISNECMSWVVVQRHTSREDHSGGKEIIQELGARYGVKPERSGPPGSEGIWEIPDLGYCKRLWPMAPVVTPADYTSPGISPWEKSK